MNSRNQIKSPSPLIIIMFLVFLALWCLSIATVYRNGFFKGLSYPFNTPFPHPVTRFGDFFGPYTAYVLNHGVSAGISYFPSVFLVLEFFYNINKDPWSVLPYYIYIWPAFSFIFIVYVSIKQSKGVLTGALCGLLVTLSYPSIFTFHTGNFEGLVACLLLFGTYAALNNRWELFGLAIGTAASMKGLPIGFLLLPLLTSSFRNFLNATKVALVSIFLLTLVPLVVLPNGFLDGGFFAVRKSLNSMNESFRIYKEVMVNSEAGIHYGHSLLNSVHAFMGMNFMPPQTWGTAVMLILILIGAVISIFLRKFGAPSWLVLSLIGAVGCLAPSTSTDYKLLYFAPSILAFVLAGEERVLALLPMILVVFAMSSKPWLNVGTDAWANATVYLTTFSMLLLIPITVSCAFIWSRQQSASESEGQIFVRNVPSDVDPMP